MEQKKEAKANSQSMALTTVSRPLNESLSTNSAGKNHIPACERIKLILILHHMKKQLTLKGYKN